jgi:hypothetical protein
MYATTPIHMRVTFPAVAVTILVLCSTVEARSDQSADRYQSDRGSRQSSREDSSRMSPDGGRLSRDDRSSPYHDQQSRKGYQKGYHWKQMTGEIERVKKVNIRGTQQDHLAVLVLTDRGNRVVADLGPARNLRDVEVLAGDRIAARGPVFRINDRLVMFAKRIRADGQTITIKQPFAGHRDRSQQAQPGTQPDQQSSQSDQAGRAQTSVRVNGQVKELQELTVKGTDKTHQVVRLTTEEGKEVIVDLGAKNDLREVDIRRDQQLMIQGTKLRVAGNPFILAHQISTDGRTMQIDRDMVSAIPALRKADRVQGRAKEHDQQGGAQSVSGEVIVKGEVLQVDRDGFYIVKDEEGREVHLIVSENMNQGLNIGDRIQAQVQADGTVTSIAKASDHSPESSNQPLGKAAHEGGQ